MEGVASASGEPRIMGISHTPATMKLRARIGIASRVFDVIKLNEAFVSQEIAVLRKLGIAEDVGHMNSNSRGGGVRLSY